MSLFQTKIRFFGHNIYQGTIIPISRSIEFADQFSDELREKKPITKVFRMSKLCF